MAGRHQRQNACVALYLAELLNENFGFSISRKAVFYGLANAIHRGRLELMSYGNLRVLFDGAHNVAGADALKNYLDESERQSITMIFGAMRDKDLSEIGEILFPKADKLILTKPDNPRSMETKELMKFLPENFDAKNVFETQTVADALKIAEEISGAENLICVTGSLYLVGEAQKLLNNKSKI